MSKVSYPIRPQLKGRSVVLPSRIGFCFWCGKDLSFDRRRISFCSIEHSDLYYKKFIFNDSVSGGTILSKDDFTCRECGFDLRKFQEELSKKFPWGKDLGKKRDKYIESKGFSLNQARLEIDHIIPVRMGGDPVVSKNQQTLCYRCHKEKSKKDVGQIAQINAVCREIRGNIKLKKHQKKMENYWNTILTPRRDS